MLELLHGYGIDIAKDFAYVYKPLLAGLLVSILCGILGSIIVSNKSVFIAGGIAHGSFGGIGVALLLGISPMLGAFIAAIILAIALVLVSFKNRANLDALTLAFWACGMALGVIALDFYDGYGVDLAGYLFGSILIVHSLDIYMLASFDALLLLALALFFRPLLALLFDPVFMQSAGMPVRSYTLLLYILIAIGIVLSMELSGLILILALMSIPAYIALLFAHSLGRVMALAIAFSAIFMVVGIFMSYLFDLSVGASVALISSLALFIALFFKR